jgi:hypothetical protein
MLCQTGTYVTQVTDGLEQAAHLAWALARPGPATELASAAAALRLRAAPAVSLIDLEDPGVLHAKLQDALGPAAFAVHWAAGQAQSRAQVIAAALAL